MLALMLCFWACGRGASGESAAETGGGAETGGLPLAELPDPTWDADGVTEQLAALPALGLPDPGTLLEIFQGMWVGADPDCPHIGGSYSLVESFGGCETDDGYTFGGVSIYDPGEDGDFWLLGDCFIVDDQDRTFYASGEIDLVSTDEGWTSKLTGIWGYPGAESPWASLVPGLALWLSRDLDGVHLGGSYGLGDLHLFFDEVNVADGCPTGTVWLRDPQGSWYLLSLDEDCSGCGELTYGDVVLGEACVDLASATEDLADRVED